MVTFLLYFSLFFGWVSKDFFEIRIFFIFFFLFFEILGNYILNEFSYIFKNIIILPISLREIKSEAILDCILDFYLVGALALGRYGR